MGDRDSVDEGGLARRVYDFGERYIDYKLGLIGAGIMGGVVFGINYAESYDLIDASIAAGKQASYTFCLGGVFMRGCEYLATHIKKTSVAIAAAVLVPSMISIGATYALHSRIRPTKNPAHSTLPTAAIIPGTAIHGYLKRRKYCSENVEKL